jgi:hypothetical protein
LIPLYWVETHWFNHKSKPPFQIHKGNVGRK